MRALDAFCCAGGATRGYQLAGFHVTGVDQDPQPNYIGDAFHQGDALAFIAEHGHEFDVIHASPPCQHHTAYRRVVTDITDRYDDLLEPTRAALEATGKPYIIENVVGAPLRSPVMLCGSSFGLDIRRHRLFESNVMLLTPPCDHGWQTPRFAPASNRTNLRCTVEVGVWRIPLEVQQRAMGMDWSTLRELSEAIPPAYTECLGAQLLAHLAVPA